MSDTVDVSIPITLELSPSLEALVLHRKLAQFKRRVASDVNSLLEQLGLPGEPLVDVRSMNSRRPVRIRIHGALEPFEPALLAQAWLAVAPPRLRYLPDSTFGRQTFSPAAEWFGSFVEANKESSDANVPVDCLRRLVLEVLRRRPGCLVGPAQAHAYIGKASPPRQLSPESISVDSLEFILTSLLNLGVTVKSPLLWQTLTSQQETALSVEKITESVFAQLRADRIEIHINPDYLKKLSPAFRESDLRTGGIKERIKNLLLQLRAASFAQLSPGFNNLLLRMEEKFFTEFGLRLPETVLLTSAEIPDQLIAFKINDRLGPPRLGLKPEELLVHTSMGRLAALNLKARPAINPLNGQESGVIDAASRDVAEQNNLDLSDASEFIALALYGELSRQADQLLSIDDTEYQLARLEQSRSSLVRAVGSRYSSSDLTQTMRGLLAEELSVRNPKEIFERLVQFDTIPCYDDKYRIFDDRLPIAPTGSPESLTNYREFVRSGLVNYISHKYAPNQDSLVVIRIELVSEGHAKPDNENLNVEKPRALTEVQEERFRDGIWTVLMTKPVSSAPVIVTTNVLRPIIRRLTSGELPHLPVLAESELKPAINFNIIGTIGFSEDDLAPSRT